MDHAPIVTIDGVREAVDFDPGTGALAYGNDVKALAEQCEPALEFVAPVEVSFDGDAIHFDTIVLWPEALGFQGLELAPVAQGEGASDIGGNARTSAGGRSVKLRLLGGEFGIVGIDGSLDESHVGIFG